ncbi:hypothetical protein OHT76_04955 [Streptomyces sp. NBC_00287]|uniref:hypothetical protein n=1 Tax=Streptomyces sp. NBC_00287 TaxID=2975702 RepID=UPI002E2D8019|nr:hypothetical protein [Streptomyces sp. NBC_00287]
MKAQQGELIRVYQLHRLHTSRGRAERTGQLFTVAARLAAGAAVLLGWLAGALLWWQPDPAGLRRALVLGGAGLGCGVLWAVLLWWAARWLRHGMIADAGSKRPRVAGLVPDNWGEPEWLWDTLRIANLVLMGIPIAGLVLAGLGAAASAEDADVGLELRWAAAGCALLLTGLMGGIVGGLSTGLGAETEECWTPRGAVGWLIVYGVPFLLAAPWLSGRYESWAGWLVALAVVWLLIAPVNKVAKGLPSVSSD